MSQLTAKNPVDKGNFNLVKCEFEDLLLMAETLNSRTYKSKSIVNSP